MHRTLEGKVVLYALTAQRSDVIERWPVDARGMVACGDWSYDPPEGVSPPATVAFPTGPTLPPALPPHPLSGLDGGPKVTTVAATSATATPGAPFTGPVRTKAKRGG